MVTDDRGAGADRRRRRLEEAVGNADHARDPLRFDRAPGRPRGPRRGRHLEHQLDRASAGRGDAGPRALLRRLAHRPREAAAGDLAAAPPARNRPAADDRPRRTGRCADLRSADGWRGGDPGGDPGAHRRRPRPGGRHRAARPGSDPPEPERRERAQRRDLRAAAVRGRRRRRRRIAHLGRAKRGDPAARGDRLRRRRGSRRRAPDRSRHRLCGPQGPDRGHLAPGDPGARAPPSPTAPRARSTDRASSRPSSPAWSSEQRSSATPRTSTGSPRRSGACSTASPSSSSARSCSGPRSGS